MNAEINTLFVKYIFSSKVDAHFKVILFKNKPTVLLPFAWVHRWYDLCKNDSARVRKYFSSLGNKTDDKINEEYKMLQAMGFYKDK